MTIFAFVALLAVTSPASDDIASPWREYWRTRRAECNASIERIRKSDVSVALRDDKGNVLADKPCRPKI